MQIYVSKKIMRRLEPNDLVEYDHYEDILPADLEDVGPYKYKAYVVKRNMNNSTSI